jgi:pyridoxal phosphate enzyme (YggS family)
MTFTENYAQIQSRIEAACARSGRPSSSVLLLPVSKGQPADAIREAAAAGLQIFGESKVQEAKIKISQCPSRLQWHMIGHLQSNKCRDAVLSFQMIQSVDSFSLAEELNKWAEKLGRHVPILLEVNVAGESSKFGYKPDALLAELIQLNKLSRLEIHGLMTIAPYSQEPEKVRPFFTQLARLRERCNEILGAPLPHLSMGMSGDFEVAIEEGATIVRIGTALFGQRKSAVRTQAAD